MNITTQVLRAREGGAVKRVHTIPWIGEYNVAQHTFGMLVLLDLLYDEHKIHDDDWPYIQLTQHILWHDVAERWTGDAPGGLRYFDEDIRKNFKLAEKEVIEKFNFPLKELPDWNSDKAWVRSLDQLEFWLACHDQRALGNKNVEPYIDAATFGPVSKSPSSHKIQTLFIAKTSASAILRRWSPMIDR